MPLRAEALLDLAFGLALHRLGPGLEDVELAVDAVLAPLDVHRPAVVLLDHQGVAGQLGHVGVAQRIAVAQLGRGVLGRHQLAVLALLLGRGEAHADQLGAEVAADDRQLAALQRRLVDVELVGIDGALDHGLAEAVARGDEDDVGEAALGVDREHHAGRADVAAHHPLHPGRERDVAVRVALVHAVADGAVVVEAGEDLAHLRQHLVDAGDVEEGLLLAGERRVRQVLGGGRGAHREGRAGAVGRQALVFAADRRLEGRRKRLLPDPAADLGAGLGQGAHVVGVEAGEALADPLGQPAFGEELAEGMRRGREAAGDADARLAQLADHFAEGGVLAADRLDIGHSQLFEAGDEGGRQVGG